MKQIKLFTLALGMLMMFSMALFAQTEPPTDPPTTDPIDLQLLFGTLFSVAALVIPITGWINNAFGKLEGVAARIVSWILPLVISYVGWFFDLGIFGDLGPVTTALYGLAIAVVGNGLFTWDVVKTILELIGAKVPKTK